MAPRVKRFRVHVAPRSRRRKPPGSLSEGVPGTPTLRMRGGTASSFGLLDVTRFR